MFAARILPVIAMTWFVHASPAPAAGALSTAPLIGSWLAEDIRGGGVIDNARTAITLAEDGRATGSGGCNRIFGEWRVAAGQIMIGPLASTRKMCAPALMDQEAKFLAMLADARSFTREGIILRLRDANGAEIARLAQQE